MAARLTDHVWTTTELLSYRVPPHFLDTLPALERLYPPFEETHHGSCGTLPGFVPFRILSTWTAAKLHRQAGVMVAVATRLHDDLQLLLVPFAP